MSQPINLFDPSLRRPRPALSTVAILGALVVVMAAMTGYGYYARQRLHNNEAVLKKANLDFKQLTEDLAKAGGKPVPMASKALIEEIASVEARAGARRALIDQLKGGGIGNTQGYSVYMTALARQHAEGIWLTGLSLAEGGAEFLIHGRALRAELLPGYLALLNREEALRGRIISEMRLIEGAQEAAANVAAQGGPQAQGAMAAGKAEGAQVQAPVRFVEFTIGSGATAAAGR